MHDPRPLRSENRLGCKTNMGRESVHPRNLARVQGGGVPLTQPILYRPLSRWNRISESTRGLRIDPGEGGRGPVGGAKSLEECFGGHSSFSAKAQSLRACLP